MFEHAGKVYSVAENHFPYEIDISNLDTRNVWTLSGSWGRPFTSHPKVGLILYHPHHHHHHHSDMLVYIKILNLEIITYVTLRQKDPITGEMIIMGVDAKKPYYVLGVVSGNVHRSFCFGSVLAGF